MPIRRRDLLGMLGGGALASLLLGPRRALADAPGDEFFVFIHAAGGWDVTLWADPRNERKGLVEPAHTGNCDLKDLKLFRPVALDGDARSFELITAGKLRFGPAIGELADLHDRLTIINGLAMNTVSHEDGTAFSTTGRHRQGGALSEPSVDAVVASELGAAQRMPNVSIRFPSAFVGTKLDQRTLPLRVASVDGVTKAFTRADGYLEHADRAAMAAVLADEARQLAANSKRPVVYNGLTNQHTALPALLAPDLVAALDPKQLRTQYPQFRYKGELGDKAVAAPFAIEAFKRNLVRCVGFALGGLDTHEVNYRRHPIILQDLFNIVATLVKALDATPHPTKPSAKLADHTHIVVVSEFCRTPQINPQGGRDHYPNNSALVISPKFRSGLFGATDVEQLLPVSFGKFTDGERALAPPDLLATFLAAFGIDPRKHMRDGEVVKALLA